MSEPPPRRQSVKDPAGAWPMDKNLTKLSGLQPLFVSSKCSFGILHNTYFVKLVPGCSSLVAHKLRMMLLAEDCSVIPLGRVFNRGILCGFITLRERTITQSAGQFERPDSRRHKTIQSLALLQWISLLCDFAEATKKGSSMPPQGFTLQYAAPALLSRNPRPLTVAEDLYSLGITIWEIYTGQIPFDGFDKDTLEDFIRSGGQPDMSLVDDANILALITMSLEATDKQLDLCFGHYVSNVGPVRGTRGEPVAARRRPRGAGWANQEHNYPD
ncbi:Protein kinase domain [Rhizoctonia solani]|uniref:Protein kinase domain n=1 Tax=Rhizoctonia solani TaxID=456999 RepID=A0A8H7M0A3_9AGAM|nr:Protein kinase domain [Rhizoctonia solani]